MSRAQRCYLSTRIRSAWGVGGQASAGALVREAGLASSGGRGRTDHSPWLHASARWLAGAPAKGLLPRARGWLTKLWVSILSQGVSPGSPSGRGTPSSVTLPWDVGGLLAGVALDGTRVSQERVGVGASGLRRHRRGFEIALACFFEQSWTEASGSW